ncbi:CheY-like chemotaxis protein [Bradyrhizobium japonicum]|nr:CheY-like chemotaxis protein [Bradyrhizobium japonicum]
MIRMMVADMLEELGHTVSAEAANLAQALALASSAEFDFAILDFSLGAETSVSVADALLRSPNDAPTSNHGARFLRHREAPRHYHEDQRKTPPWREKPAVALFPARLILPCRRRIEH